MLDFAEVFHRISGKYFIDSSVASASVFLLADFFMAQRYDAEHAQGYAQEILTRWCVIAEQRLDHLTELYETGRWRRYHSENAFLENLREAKTAVETWRVLAQREATPDNAAVDWSWLDRSVASVWQTPLMRNEVDGSQAGVLGTVAVHAALTSIQASQEDDSLAGEAADDAANGEEIKSEAEFSDEMVPDNRSVQERYPVLHVAL